MRIIIDAMSGDNAPLEIVKGALEAAGAYPEAEIALSGDRTIIENTAAELGMSLGKITVIDAVSVITMEDEPNSVVKDKKDSSMAKGLLALKEGGDAFVSAGNTGALHVGSTLLIRPIKGIRRTCLATILPFPVPLMMVDCGANINVMPEYLEKWADMAVVYMKNLFGIENPRVGLLNNGAEEHKGTETEIETYKLLKASDTINFVGNVEARDIPFGVCDILVTDGFTGNVVLKYTEGFGKFFLKTLKNMYTRSLMSKVGYLAVKKQLSEVKNQFDASEYGGAPLLGLSKPVIKAHGSSDAKAIKNAVRQAIAFINTGVTEEIAELAAKKAADKAAAKETTEAKEAGSEDGKSE